MKLLNIMAISFVLVTSIYASPASDCDDREKELSMWQPNDRNAYIAATKICEDANMSGHVVSINLAKAHYKKLDDDVLSSGEEICFGKSETSVREKSKACRAIGRTYYRMGDLDDAKKFLDHSCKVLEDEISCTNLAGMLDDSGRKQEAFDMLNTYLQVTHFDRGDERERTEHWQQRLIEEGAVPGVKK